MSEFTGHGHKSFTIALDRELKCMQVHTKCVDAYVWNKSGGMVMSKIYDPIMRHAPVFYTLVFKVADIIPGVFNYVIAMNIKKGFYEELDDYNPDMILSLHPTFSGSLAMLLKGSKYQQPLISWVGDIYRISNMYLHPHIAYYVSETEEVTSYLHSKKVEPQKIIKGTLPVREGFYHSAKSPIYRDGEKLKIMVCSGSEGGPMLEALVKHLYNRYNCQVHVMTGRDVKLKSRLQKQYTDPKRVYVHGYVSNMEDYMSKMHLAIVRPSPNVMYECMHLQLPMILFGKSVGQESKNHEMMTKRGLGVFCKTVEELPNTMDQLLMNQGKALKDMKLRQRDFCDKQVQPGETLKEIMSLLYPVEEHKKGKYLQVG